MPTEDQNTMKMTDEQKKLAQSLFDRAGTGEFSKDPANPPKSEHQIKNKKFPDNDKIDF